MLIRCVTVAEVAARFAERRVPEAVVAKSMLALNVVMVELDFRTACRCGTLRPGTRSFALSLGNRACLALALELGCAALTADHVRAGLDIGLDIRVIR